MSQRKDFDWLNKDSKLFLSRGYLEEGETAEQRIKNISKTAQKYLEQMWYKNNKYKFWKKKPELIRNFSEKFEYCMARGWFSLSTPVWSNYGKKRGAPVSCVIGDTWINTRRGGGKQASDIQIGDEVLTHKGRYRKVTNIIETKNRDDIWALKVNTRLTPLYLTGDHLVKTNMGWIRTDELNPEKHLVAVNGDIDLESTDSIHEIDLKKYCKWEDPLVKDGRIYKRIVENQKPSSLALRKNGETVDYISAPFEKITVDEDVAWFLGIWFAEGSLSSSKIKNGRRYKGIRITINDKDETWVKEKWLEIAKNKFGINGAWYSSQVKRNGVKNSWLNIDVSSVIIGDFFANEFGLGCKEKLIPDWIINSPKNILSKFLEGVLIGDGTRTRGYGNKITVANPKMLLQLYQIGLFLKEPMSLQMQEKASKMATVSNVYTCLFMDYYVTSDTIKKKIMSRRGIKFEDGLVYVPIRKLERTNKIETVYDFTVAEDHSFSAAGVILHNCFGSRTELDSCESIIYTNAEIATMTQKGGGTSIYIGDLRPRGSKISSGGVSDGPISFLGLFESSANIMKQGCYAFDTEVLTEKGWMLFEDIINRSEIKVAQVHDDDSIDFVTPDNYFKYEVDEELILFKDSKNIDLLVTQNHNMRYKRLDRVNTKKDKDGKYISNEKFLNPKVFTKQAKDMPLYRNIILNNSGFAKATSNNCLTHKERFLIALQADGHINKLTNKLDFHFSKQRKIDRLINILSNLEGYSYIKQDSKSDNTTYIIVTPPEGIQHTKQFDWVNLNTISKEWCLDFVLELLEWDGSKNANNPINGKYSSTMEYNVDIAQCVASMCGYKTRKTTVARDESRHCIYNLQLSKGEHFGVEKLKPELLPYKGFVYCVEVPTHNILVRRNGHVTVCGNSTRRGSLAAYLPIEHPDIMEFLDIRMEGCPLQNILSGVTVGDEWFEEMKAGDKGKRKVWAKLMKARAFAGVPYILFRDNANKNKPQVYKDKNMEIVASNLCVTGDQRVVSDRGLLTVKELYEQGGSLKLFDNDKIVNASPMQLIEKDADVFKITLENGLEHSITGYHKVSTKNGNVSCSDLKVGDMVRVQTKSMYGDNSGYFPEYEDYYISFNSYNNGVGSKQEIYGALKNLTLEQKIFLASRGELINDDGCSKIVSIEHIGKEDVYCTTVDSQEHLWICNGFITSNCNEIMLPSSEEESFVCVLSSINLLYYDEWKDTDAPEILLAFLDTVNEEFVIKTNNMPFMKRANRFAKRHRALGLGVLGWHSYLQKNMIPFGSFVAMGKTNEIFSKINDKTLNMTKQLASWFGEPELLKGYGERNTTRCALAPTKSSSFILGQVSQSIEPYHSNYFVDDKAKAQVVFKNPYLKEVLKKYDKDDQEVWDSIKDANGSVQHLKFLTDEEREVFKTFGEISQMDIIKQAGIRQKYIDQGQSLNLMIHPKCSAKDENQLYIASHEEGLKGLYYRKSFNAASEFRRELVSCSTCEG